MLRLTVEEVRVGGCRVAHELVNKGIEIAIEQMSAQAKIARRILHQPIHWKEHRSQMIAIRHHRGRTTHNGILEEMLAQLMTACQRMNAEHREIGVGSQRTLARHECPLVVAMQHARLGTQAVVHDVVVIGEQAHKQEHRRHDHQIMPPRRHQERCSERLPVELLPLADEHHDNNK